MSQSLAMREAGPNPGCGECTVRRGRAIKANSRQSIFPKGNRSTMYETMTYPSTTLSTRFPLSVRETSDTAFDDFWGEPIHVYTRQQAIADGVLFDASSGEIAPVSLQHFGPKAHVAMTAALHHLIERAVTNPKTWNDWKGVWHDICWMSTVWQVKREKTEYAVTAWFEVTITGAGRKRKHLLKRHMQPDGNGGVEITFMLPDED